MVVWGVVSSEIEQVIEFFGSLHEAERMLEEVVGDEPDWRDGFRIVRIELGSESLNEIRPNRQRPNLIREAAHLRFGIATVGN
jgi:hypothetical protein